MRNREQEISDLVSEYCQINAAHLTDSRMKSLPRLRKKAAKIGSGALESAIRQFGFNDEVAAVVLDALANVTKYPEVNNVIIQSATKTEGILFNHLVVSNAKTLNPTQAADVWNELFNRDQVLDED